MPLLRFRSGVAAVTLAVLAFAPQAFSIPGALQFPLKNGKVVKREIQLNFPKNWQGPLQFKAGETVLSSSQYQWQEIQGTTIFSVAFTNLPEDKDNTVLIFKGVYEAGRRYYGEVFSHTYPKPLSGEELTTVLQGVNFDTQMQGYAHKASFYLGKAPAGARARRTGEAPSQDLRPDSNNPCPNGPCWSNGGVGRHREYYAGGPIQNPGHARPAAGFNRGVPYAWTWEGQLAANQVGIQRSRFIYGYQLRTYNNWGWGFFGLPWAWGRIW